MGNVVEFFPNNAAENPDNVLKQAVGEYEAVLVLGWNKDGTADPRASMNITTSEVFMLCDLLKARLIENMRSE